MKRRIAFWFIAPPLMLRDVRDLTVYVDVLGREYVMARRRSRGRCRVLLDTPTDVYLTKSVTP